jgi:hypothetical protein
MNNVRKGYLRDNAVLDWIDRCQVLSTDQIAALEFRFPTGRRKAQQRLRKLVATKQLHRSYVGEYVFHIERIGQGAAHRVALNWALIWLLRQKQNWERVVSWEYEPDYGYMRPDLLLLLENTVTKKLRATYVELDRSRNRWDKVGLYNRLYAEESYSGAWWVEDTDRFPAILAATTSEARARLIKDKVRQENIYHLRFEVRVLDQLRSEVSPWARS